MPNPSRKTKKCPACGHAVSKAAGSCPQCAHPFHEPGGLNLANPLHLIGLILAVAAGLVIVFAMVNALR